MSDYRMSDLAAEDGYDPFAAEKYLAPVLADQSKFMAGQDVNAVKAIGSGMGDILTLPERAVQNSQFATTTGVYDPRVPVEAALMTMGGGIGGTGEKAGVDLAAGYDPKLWHGVSSIKLPKPIDEMSSLARPINPASETVISPARLQNSMLMPLLGDRTASAAALERVNGFQFDNPVSLQGGHGYMANNPNMAWAAGKSIAPGIANTARAAAQTDLPVHGVYTAMGERSADFSHMVSDTLAEMAKHTKITPEGAQIFNDTMRKIAPDFPGVQAPNVAEYLRGAPGELRNTFAKTMDTSKMQAHGFPSVAEARVAVTDPRLLNEPTGASGLSIARMDPYGTLGPSGHATYDTGIAGNYIGGLPASVPKEIMWPDIVAPLAKHADAVAAARDAAGLKPFRPTEDYLMGRTPKGLPKLQEANQQWVDSVSQHLLDRGFTLGAGATDQKGAAALQGIRAYHSSPQRASEVIGQQTRGGTYYEVLKNPTKGELLSIAKDYPTMGRDAPQMRVMHNADGDVYAWPASYATHDDISQKLNLGKISYDARDNLSVKGSNLQSEKATPLDWSGFLLGAGATEKPGAAAIQGIRAYHSSPHDFDKFDLSKIGTGEGAQVYGHGLYFAENPAVSGRGGQYWNAFKNKFDNAEGLAADHLQRAGFDREKAVQTIQEQLAERKREPWKYVSDDPKLDQALAMLRSDKPVGPRTYEVNINADPAHFLDWDKPLREQAVFERLPSDMREKIRRAGEETKSGWGDLGTGNRASDFTTGRTVYNDLATDIGMGRAPAPAGFGNNPAGGASHILSEAGIPGIKYLDQGSRPGPARFGALFPDPSPTPTSNYVVFNPSIVDIMKKYGIAGAAPLGALAAQDAYQPQE